VFTSDEVNSSSKNDDKELHQQQPDYAFKLQQDQIAKLFDILSDFNRAPTAGPLYAFSREFRSYSEELTNTVKILAQIQTDLVEYWRQINNAYKIALNESIEKSPKEYNSKEDLENHRKIIINALENAFTGLFDSKEFAVIYGQLTSDQLDLFKNLQRIYQIYSKVLNLPTREEIDEIIKDVHDLKRTVYEMKKNIEALN
jgi:poly[(R)-3-hydroxyalkanoate] polymerase subunit PhaE